MEYIKVGGSGIKRYGSFNRHSTTLGQAGKRRSTAGQHAQPVKGKTSAACQRGAHSMCYMLTCSCNKCGHTQGGK